VRGEKLFEKKVLRIFGLKREGKEEAGERCMVRRSIICTLHQIL
jgi:hypothetical protein